MSGESIKTNKEIVAFNKSAWDGLVRQKNQWTVPVTPEQVEEARQGILKLVLTPQKLIPAEWYPKKGSKILALASGGGQQGPLLAAAGYDVTVFDNSPLQLSRDREVAEREGLTLQTCEGDMANLSVFADESFDFIIHPCSNCFVPDINPVWKEAYRVLRKGGSLISGLVNPIVFMLDVELEKQGIAQLRYPLPYSDLKDLTEDERIKFFGAGEPYTFGHTLEDQIGGQLRAGFLLQDYYEDSWDADKGVIHKFLKAYIATQVIKI